jgi:N-acetylglucosaminyldiphosphoundecaprenol N-acetyl-beta-D-mannosaminyltransferase
MKYSLYLLGNPLGVAEKAGEVLVERFPDLQIAGAQDGFFDKRHESKENLAVIERINSLQPNILLVGFGMPMQERWLDENCGDLQVNVAITCGALFEYLAGSLKRGPRWMTEHSLEWLARTWISPARYAGRYMRDIPLFLYRLAKQRLYGK